MRRYLATGLVVAVIVAVFVVVLPRIADYGSVWRVLTGMSGPALAVLLGAAVLNILTFPPPWMAAVPGLGFRHAMVLTQASTAASAVLPGGDVVGMGTQFAMLKGWGFGAQRATLAVLVTGVWNQLVNVAFPVTAVVLLAWHGTAPRQLTIAALIGAALLAVVLTGFVLVLSRAHYARSLGDLAGRVAGWATRVVRRPRTPHWGDDAVRFRDQSLWLVRRRWPHLTIGTIAGHITVFLVLLAALRAVDIPAHQVSAVEVFAAWSFIRILTAVPITPGGLGVVELGLTGMLVAFGGQRAPVVAGILAYRALTMIPPIVLGAICLGIWRRGSINGGDGAPAAPAGPEPVPPPTGT